MSKVSKATEFSAKERHTEPDHALYSSLASGVGNCKKRGVGHHTMLDNGNQGRREEMLSMFREYLKRHYRDWNEADLVYKKYDF